MKNQPSVSNLICKEFHKFPGSCQICQVQVNVFVFCQTYVVEINQVSVTSFKNHVPRNLRKFDKCSQNHSCRANTMKLLQLTTNLAGKSHEDVAAKKQFLAYQTCENFIAKNAFGLPNP